MEKKRSSSVKSLSFKAAPVQIERIQRESVVHYAKSLQDWHERSLRSKKRLGCAYNPFE